MSVWFRSSPVRRWLLALVLVAVGALVVMLVAVGSRTERGRMPERFVASELPASPVGRQMRWLIAASGRLPLSEREWRAHLARELFALPGASPAQLNTGLRTTTDGEAMRLLGLSVVHSDALVAIVRGRDAREFVVVVTVDRAGMIEKLSFEPSASGPAVTLPAPTGGSAVGRDAVALADPARGGRRLMVTRWYPATSTRGRPLAVYASPRLTATLGLPPVRVHARNRAPARRARLPVVLFSPGRRAPRIFYQALAEDLASHGYLVIAVDHTGEAPVEFPHGDIQLPSTDRSSLAAASTTRLADVRLILHRLILHRANATSKGPRPDSGRIAVVGHSLGGSTAAAVVISHSGGLSLTKGGTTTSATDFDIKLSANPTLAAAINGSAAKTDILNLDLSNLKQTVAGQTVTLQGVAAKVNTTLATALGIPSADGATLGTVIITATMR